MQYNLVITLQGERIKDVPVRDWGFFAILLKRDLVYRRMGFPVLSKNLHFFLSPGGQNKLCAITKIISSFIKTAPNNRHLNDALKVEGYFE